MQKKFHISIIAAGIFILFAICSTVFAQSIKERFKDRLPKIIQLKAEGVIGENNMGYLEFIGTKKKMEEVVNEENEDRRLVYEKIAENEKTTVEKVGRRRAIQLRGLAKPGDWLQDDSGNWYQK